MGNDLVSACVLCAGLVLGLDLAPPAGWSAEMAATYATSARRYAPFPDREDTSAVTAKLMLLGLGQSRAAKAGLGAGTADFEWRFRIAVAPSHQEQQQGEFEQGQTTAMGTGRFENMAMVVRLPISFSDSIELGGNRRRYDATDLINLGGDRLAASGQRTLSEDRIDVALGWRHRWKGLEASISGVYLQPSATNGTAGAFHHTGGNLFGGAFDARARKEKWTLTLAAQRTAGELDVHELTAPGMVERNFGARSSLEAYRIGIGWSNRRTDVFFSATYDRSHLPFVAHAVLGTEILAFEQGFHPDSRSRQWLLDLSVRDAVTPWLRPRAILRWARGTETLTLTDSAGVVPTRQLEIERYGIVRAGLAHAVGNPEFTIGFGAEIALPPGR